MAIKVLVIDEYIPFVQITCKNDEKFIANISGCSFVRPLALIDMKTQVQRCGAYRLRKETDDVYLVEKMHKKVFNLSGD